MFACSLPLQVQWFNMTIEIYMNLWVAARELSAELQLDDRETLINPYSEARE